ncbi:hypothetical protein CALVIDRAFT_266431 [Calocera viscosa TUFC12733]|uniref:Uncharacterized protein n=1 Tax=Calocera viscosa (strain TUFC12733) TaxID=1330018 RepID=A0A167IWS8_CALVF|nr:hypothetical protein CALVIDRAFT_266431 [Calocera viscosa TUFC12733]
MRRSGASAQSVQLFCTTVLYSLTVGSSLIVQCRKWKPLEARQRVRAFRFRFPAGSHITPLTSSRPSPPAATHTRHLPPSLKTFPNHTPHALSPHPTCSRPLPPPWGYINRSPPPFSHALLALVRSPGIERAVIHSRALSFAALRILRLIL